MRPELRKLMVLPTPRWTAAVVVAGVVIAAIVVAITGPGKENLALMVGIGMPTWVASIVIGVWMAGLEYGQKTMRRTLSRNPNRLEVVASKLAVAVGAAVSLTIVATLVAVPLFALASAGHDTTIAASDTIKVGIGDLANNVVYVIAGFSLGLITRSMAGGMAIALGFFFVIDSLLTSIPKVGDFMLSAVSLEIFQQIVGNEIAQTDLDVNLARALLLTAVWLGAFVAAGSLRFLKTDVD
jgi:ABC-2 type transport system permease protein